MLASLDEGLRLRPARPSNATSSFGPKEATPTLADEIERLWKEKGATEQNPRPFIKYLYSRVVAISFLSRLVTYDGEDKKVVFRLQSLPKLPVDPALVDEGPIIAEFLELGDIGLKFIKALGRFRVRHPFDIENPNALRDITL